MFGSMLRPLRVKVILYSCVFASRMGTVDRATWICAASP